MSDDDEALRPKRINRNARIREALYAYEKVRLRVLTALDGTLHTQYPMGTHVRWGETEFGPWHEGQVIAASAPLGHVAVRNKIVNIKRGEIQILSIHHILWGGDSE